MGAVSAPAWYAWDAAESSGSSAITALTSASSISSLFGFGGCRGSSHHGFFSRPRGMGQAIARPECKSRHSDGE